ncbi:hypothetical protein FACS189473_4810 [Spirochaetia bacterium]|nr:hypothetical protein FACS189473_4810 [Spirochaetia bacterium]
MMSSIGANPTGGKVMREARQTRERIFVFSFLVPARYRALVSLIRGWRSFIVNPMVLSDPSIG